MNILKKAGRLSDLLQELRKNGKTIGFVPTMGALHPGHLSLIQASLNAKAFTVCSIFVNPSQFNNPDDFKHYPKVLENDIALLEATGCDVLFIPSVAEIYPPGYKVRNYDLGELENKLEGLYRPGHFQGVCQVVDRLLQIVGPCQLYLGQKDFQQCLVIKKLLQLTNREPEVKIAIVPTVREDDGLAMSSRNMRLSSMQRQLAIAIYGQLLFIKNNLQEGSFKQLKASATAKLENQGFHVDYVSIAKTDTLDEAPEGSVQTVGLVAASIGDIRLIDNMLLN